MEKANHDLEVIQTKMAVKGYSDELHIQELEASNNLVHVLNMQRTHWKEKSRMQWVPYGDPNTKIFHNYAKIRASTNKLSHLKVDGNLKVDHDVISEHIVSYFNGLYAGASDCVQNDFISNHVEACVSAVENSSLTAMPDMQEVRDAVFSMNANGAPGPDGFGGIFFTSFWDIVGEDVLKSFQFFFEHGWLVPNANPNHIVLLPKEPGDDVIEKFRPIALGNFHFNIIGTILATRLSPIATRIISPQQRAFLKGRNIFECISLTSEAINLLDYKCYGGNVALKFDIRKAFDTLDWDFLLQTLSAFGLCSKFVGWIRNILQSARLSVVVNDKAMGYFGCTIGVHQGDPLSPILFCLAEDILSRGVTRHLAQALIHTISSPRGTVAPSHILYADDIMVFCKGTSRDIGNLMKLFKDYGACSGQIISTSKCTLFVSKHIITRASPIAANYGIPMGTFPFRYLGVPIFRGKPRKRNIQSITERIKLNFSTWKGKSLSMMGRVELVQSVIVSSSLYSFHVYEWPKACIHTLESWMRNFIWSGDISIVKHTTVGWEKHCLPVAEGGLNIKPLVSLNHAALMKTTWKIMTGQAYWCSFIKTRLSGHSYKKSSILPGIRRQWDRIKQDIFWLVSNGTKIDFWRDNWCGTLGSSIGDFLELDVTQIENKLADFIVDSNWQIPGYMPELQGLIQQHI